MIAYKRLGWLSVLTAALLYAQTDRGIITGTVTDATGAVVPGAKVTATNVATNVPYSTETTAAGNFTIPSLPPGTYTLRVEARGFKTYERSNLVVAAGATVSANVSLEVGQITESVSVVGTLVQLQTETAKSATQVSTRMVDELPLVSAARCEAPLIWP